jgi:ubiquinone/menaquinone biosynthesis C-methylase UbiE
MNILTFDEIDSFLARISELSLISCDTAYAELYTNTLALPDNLPADPFSEEYRAVYLDLYKRIANRPEYKTDNEQVDFDIAERTLRPFPYYSKSLTLAGQHFSLMGTLLGLLGQHLTEGAEVLECGVGYGNTTLALSMLGMRVTALDINPRYCEVVKRRAAMLETEVELIEDDFFWITRTDRQFDAVVFFESFHHCWDFERLLRELHRVVKPGGRIHFGAEPINDEFAVPWGVRIDGESLMVARAFGWMELGFHSDYFHELLMRNGWTGKNVQHNFWVAERRTNPLVVTADSDKIGSMIGTKQGNHLLIRSPSDDAQHYAIFGPYIYLPAGQYEIELHVAHEGEAIPVLVVDACHDKGAKQVYFRQSENERIEGGVIRFTLVLEEAARDLEIRVSVMGGGTWSLDMTKLTIFSPDLPTSA